VSVAILELVTVLGRCIALRCCRLAGAPHIFFITGVNNNAAVIVWADRGKPDQEHPTPTSACSRDAASATTAERDQCRCIDLCAHLTHPDTLIIIYQ
jgi:hypothetical protein